MEADLEVDALGLLCPLPVLRLRKRMTGVTPGGLVRLMADDPAAQIDVPHFCHEAGHVLEEAEPLGPPADGKVPMAYLVRVGS